MKIKIFILSIILSFNISSSYAFSKTWEKCILTYSYKNIKSDKILSSINKIEKISNFKFKKLDLNTSEKADIDIEYFGKNYYYGETIMFGLNGYTKYAKINLYNKDIDTIMHELLHAIGVEHSKNKKSLMYPDPYKGQILTKQDLKNIKSIQCKSRI